MSLLAHDGLARHLQLRTALRTSGLRQEVLDPCASDIGHLLILDPPHDGFQLGSCSELPERGKRYHALDASVERGSDNHRRDEESCSEATDMRFPCDVAI